MVAPRLIKTPRDAEFLARDFLEEDLGFEDVVVMPTGPDGGVDVRGPAVVAQVKFEGIKTDSPRLQALTGIAAVEGKQAVFFSLGGYTKSAIVWAERAGMALFEFDYSGDPAPRPPVAEQLIEAQKLARITLQRAPLPRERKTMSPLAQRMQAHLKGKRGTSQRGSGVRRDS